ncbi:kynurenine 3-monooxygenase, mitochondrial precursor [Arachnomyces sp. PD_36]|nr:kynurenine 3-monooxygenase, mitochondrial precursor [Arachnomyces sp. PD_36]
MAELKGRQKVIVIGAGPVGSLAALFAAARGDEVELYELRAGISTSRDLSNRSLKTCYQCEVGWFMEGAKQETFSRMLIHMIYTAGYVGFMKSNDEETQNLTALNFQGINAIDRSGLNDRLLDELVKKENVKVFFNHKLTGADFRTNKAWFERRAPGDETGTFDDASGNKDPIAFKRAPEIEVSFDLLIGADGAHSAARYHMMKFIRMDYRQEYIDALWCEFNISPSPENEYRLSPNHLHLWPGQEFLFIAMPSADKSFTCTLFAPASHYSDLESSPARLVEFFDVHFPGVCPDLIPPAELQRQFATNPHLPLISIKCSPHHFNSNAVIVGDAAHAVLPFYGQGLNAGLEDVRVLFEIFDSHGVYAMQDSEKVKAARAAALSTYSQTRVPDAHMINDLSRRNYAEMRYGLKSKLYQLRKSFEECLDRFLPSLGWSTQYARISFGNERYSDVEKINKRQGKILGIAYASFLISAIGTTGFWIWRLQQVARPGIWSRFLDWAARKD